VRAQAAIAAAHEPLKKIVPHAKNFGKFPAPTGYEVQGGAGAEVHDTLLGPSMRLLSNTMTNLRFVGDALRKKSNAINDRGEFDTRDAAQVEAGSKRPTPATNSEISSSVAADGSVLASVPDPQPSMKRARPASAEQGPGTTANEDGFRTFAKFADHFLVCHDGASAKLHFSQILAAFQEYASASNTPVAAAPNSVGNWLRRLWPGLRQTNSGYWERVGFKEPSSRLPGGITRRVTTTQPGADTGHATVGALSGGAEGV